MKKIGALIIALALLAVALPVMADTMVGGEFRYWTGTDFGAQSSHAFNKVELNITGELDEYNTVKMELDSEGDDFRDNVALDDFRLVSDLGGALGLPVAVTYTVGLFDTYFTGWNYAERSGWTGYYSWSDGLPQHTDTVGAHQMDIGVGPATIHWYNDFDGRDFMLGLDASLDFGLNLWLAYGATWQDLGGGTVAVEASYGMDIGDISLTIPAHFRYALGDAEDFGIVPGDETDAAGDFTYMVGAKAGIGMLTVAAGLEGDNSDALDNIAAELGVAAMDGLDFWATLFMDMASTNAFTGATIEAVYAVGGAKFILGYAIAGEDDTDLPVYGDAWGFNDGLYFGVDVDF